ncbi:MAG: hypothetical protein FWF72_00875 [Paludibacter sp.]|nr:hypothetical protein [Paludibacter sp.]
MKKSNIIIISFLAIFVVSVIWLFVWMKNHTFDLNNSNKPLKQFQSEQTLQPFNVLCVKDGNFSCSVEKGISENKIYFESANKNEQIENFFTQKGDTLFITGKNLQNDEGKIPSVTIRINHKIKSVVVLNQYRRVYINRQLIDNEKFNIFVENGDISSMSESNADVYINNLNITAKNKAQVKFWFVNFINVTALAADSSQISINGNIGNLSLQLENQSEFNGSAVKNSEIKTSGGSVVQFYYQFEGESATSRFENDEVNDAELDTVKDNTAPLVSKTKK